MVNVPQQPSHNLPSKRSDQLFHVIIQPRSIKTVRVATYSTSFQMHEQRGSFSGVDTCSITNVGKFDFTSILLGESEAQSIICPPDINALLNILVQEKNCLCVLLSFSMQKEEFKKNWNYYWSFGRWCSGKEKSPNNLAMDYISTTKNDISWS